MENQRTRISKQMLKKALVELMKQKDLALIMADSPEVFKYVKAPLYPV